MPNTKQRLQNWTEICRSQKNIQDKEIIDISELEAEADNAANMIKHLNEYERMAVNAKKKRKFEKTVRRTYRKNRVSTLFTGRNIKRRSTPHRKLNGKRRNTAYKRTSVSNLSEGEKLDLCVDVAISKPNALQIILIDGAGKTQ